MIYGQLLMRLVASRLSVIEHTSGLKADNSLNLSFLFFQEEGIPEDTANFPRQLRRERSRLAKHVSIDTRKEFE
jgi:hypothetical protein